ncbi:DUF4253 domain-containing protein [Paraflavitalea sp. CAU 1676]|uniref:DUF4253 domain-containing protein n=1 Tax=Paraflavitalea sp. CAU 1676 TaxID=3032598 RepID=UPI0023DBAA88|nr:DUF4253 domain-containing protein [Paraflavitalea sp. CAU 1676]MDF2189350.1 DUF4253 domain-containing protein [Paraflavitalea sp. CAU 1676]
MLLFSCNSKNNSVSYSKTPTTDTALNSLSEKTGIEIFAIKLLETETKAKPEHLKTHFSSSILPDDPNRDFQTVPGGKVVLLPGVCFPIDSDKAGLDIIRLLRPKVEQKRYKLFLCNGNDLNDKNRIAIVRCDDEFTPLVYMQTNGINYGINNHKLISHLDSLTQSLDLKLIGADFDWCEFEIRKTPQDWHKLAERLYSLCPDIVDQGTGDLKTLEGELRQTRKIYLWFD